LRSFDLEQRARDRCVVGRDSIEIAKRRRPIVALAHSLRVADQLTLEWGVYPTTIPVAESVDALIDTALVVARDYAGLSSGALVVLTAGRRAGTPGATNLIMVREIP